MTFTEEQALALEAQLDANGGQRPYKRIVHGGQLYVVSIPNTIWVDETGAHRLDQEGLPP